MQIVYVEDDAFSREVMGVWMRAAYPDAVLTILPDSKQFIAQIDKLPAVPRLFLLDVHVQPLDGFQMLDELRRHPDYAEAKIVAVTASVMNQEVVQLRGAGFNGAIAKPLDFDQFAGLIARVLDGEEVWYVT